MRATWLWAAGTVALLTLPVSAGTMVFKVSKPGVSYPVFLDDVAQCRGPTPIRFFGWTDHHPSDAERDATNKKYLSCLVAKGYRADPNGYRAGKIHYRDKAPKYSDIAP
jgi:hypothetical protein